MCDVDSSVNKSARLKDKGPDVCKRKVYIPRLHSKSIRPVDIPHWRQDPSQRIVDCSSLSQIKMKFEILY